MPSDKGDGIQPIQRASSPAPSPAAEQARLQGEQNPVPSQKASGDSTWPELSLRWDVVPNLYSYWYEERQREFTEQEKKDAWETVSSVVKEYSEDMVQRWTDEMDTLLVYAGLFSAILTAFNVQSYAMLTPAGPDPVLDALQRISEQLSSFSVNPTFANSTAPAWQQSMHTAQSLPQRWAVWLNALWFSSLICSLSSASVAIMVKQWLNEYKSGISGNSQQTARLRQYRLDGLIRWRVGTIISILPILLQISLGLFFAGLLVLLWNLHHHVALVSSVLVGVLALFTAVTFLLPIFRSDCSYQTPISLSLFYLSLPFRDLRYCGHIMFARLWETAARDSLTRRFAGWLNEIFETARPLPSLHATEKARVQEGFETLSANILTMAYTTTMDLSLLDHVVVCFSVMDHQELSGIFDRIDAENKQHGRPETSVWPFHWTLTIPRCMAYDVFLAKCLSESPRTDLSSLGPYFSALEVQDNIGSQQWNRFLSSCAVILQYFDDCLEFAFLQHLSRRLRIGIDNLNAMEHCHIIEAKTLHSVAALAYKTLQACSNGRCEDWLEPYIESIYVLLKCSQSIARQSKDDDQAFTETLHNAIEAAQSKIVDVIQAQQQNPENPEGFLLSRIRFSKLDTVGGISDAMLDAMVEYASFEGGPEFEYEEDCEWVRHYKSRQDEARNNAASMQLRTGKPPAVTVGSNSLPDPALEPSLPTILHSGHVPNIPSTSHSNIPSIANAPSMALPPDVDVPGGDDVPVPLSNRAPLSALQTASPTTLTGPDVPAITHSIPERNAQKTLRDRSRPVDDLHSTVRASELVLDSHTVIESIPQSADRRADFLRADLSSAISQQADPSKADPRADECHKTLDDRGRSDDRRPKDELEHDSLALQAPAVAGILEEASGRAVETGTPLRDTGGDEGDSTSIVRTQDVERGG